MIEEIKKELKELKTYSEYMQNINGSHWNIDTVSLCEVYEILNKHKDKENKYKNAWEELKEDCKEIEKDNDCVLFSRLEQLEKKHGIGVE